MLRGEERIGEELEAGMGHLDSDLFSTILHQGRLDLFSTSHSFLSLVIVNLLASVLANSDTNMKGQSFKLVKPEVSRVPSECWGISILALARRWAESKGMVFCVSEGHRGRPWILYIMVAAHRPHCFVNRLQQCNWQNIGNPCMQLQKVSVQCTFGERQRSGAGRAFTIQPSVSIFTSPPGRVGNASPSGRYMLHSPWGSTPPRQLEHL